MPDKRRPEVISGPVFNMDILITYRDDGRIGEYYFVAQRPFLNDRRGEYRLERWEKKYTLMGKPAKSEMVSVEFVGDLTKCNILFREIQEKLMKEFTNE